MNTNVPSSQTWWKSAGRLESHHGPIGPGCRSLNPPPAPRCGKHRSSVSESHQRSGGGGREGQLLAVAEKKGQGLGAK